MKAVLFVSIFIVNSSMAFAQIQHGTVVVINYTNDKIVVAADSRTTFMQGPPEDRACKIAAPGGKMVFASTGALAYDGKRSSDCVVKPWSNVDEIPRAYDAASLSSHGRVREAARKWADAIAANSHSLFRCHPEEVRELATKQNGLLTNAFIGGLDDDGALILLYVSIMFHDGLPRPITSEIATFEHTWTAIGENEIAREFLNLTSERARKEAREWEPPKGSKPEDRDILKAIRLVDLTIQYHDDNVGGSVDALEMDRDGTVRWFAIKDNCRKD